MERQNNYQPNREEKKKFAKQHIIDLFNDGEITEVAKDRFLKHLEDFADSLNGDRFLINRSEKDSDGNTIDTYLDL